jgi:hypothetical protein
MRRALVMLAVSFGTMAPFAVSARQDPLDKPRTLLDDARSALGGADRLAAIKGLLLKGQARDRKSGTRGNTDADFALLDDELKVLFPDNVLDHQHRTDLRTPDSFIGYSGDTLLSHMGPPPGANWQVAAVYSPVEVERMRYGLQLLALLLRADAASPFRFIGSTTDTLTFTGSAKIPEVRIEVDPMTHLPRRLTHDMVSAPGRGAAPPGRRSVVLELSDYRTVGPFQLAHRFEWHEFGLLQNVRQWQSIEIDPNLTASDFVKTEAPREHGRFGSGPR